DLGGELPALAAAGEDPGADPAASIERLGAIAITQAPNVEVTPLALVELDLATHREGTGRDEDADHAGRRATTPHQPASCTSSTTCQPASASTGRKSSASASSIPAKIASPSGASASRIAGRRRALTVRRMFEQTIRAGPARAPSASA